MKRIHTTLVCLVTATGGCAADEPWMPNDPHVAELKLVDGATIPSQLADPSMQYLSSREIESLERLGVVDMTQPVLARIDRSLSETAYNKRIDLAELVYLEQQLTSDELVQLAPVWQLMSVPKTPPLAVRVPDASIIGAVLSPPTISAGSARLVLPELMFKTAETKVGSAVIMSSLDFKMTEVRELTSDTFTVTPRLVGKRSHAVGTHTGSDRELWIHLATGIEEHAEVADAGSVVFEHYKPDGGREAYLVDWPVEEIVDVPVADYGDYEVQVVGGSATLEKYFTGVAGGAVSFEYRMAPAQVLSGAQQDVVSAVATPVSSLAPGRFQVTPTIALDLYTTGLVVAHHGGASERMTYGMEIENAAHEKALRVMIGGAPLVFVPKSNHLYIAGSPITLTASMRTN